MDESDTNQENNTSATEETVITASEETVIKAPDDNPGGKKYYCLNVRLFLLSLERF